MVKFIMLYKMILTFESVDKTLKVSVNVQKKVIDLLLLFIILSNVVLPFESVDKILKCAHSNESS